MPVYLQRFPKRIPRQFVRNAICFSAALAVVVIGLAPGVVGPVAAGPTAAGSSSALVLEPGEFDPADYDSLLKLYVRDGAVAYGEWKQAGTRALDRFLERAADYDLTSILGKEPRGAFLINAYNAWAIRQVLEHYPVSSLKDIPGFFDKNSCRIAGEDRTLDDIEAALAEILPYRPLFAFALAPGAVGLPFLSRDAYTSKNFDSRLQQAADRYILTGKRVSFDKEKNQLHLPVQFQKHLDLFRKNPKKVRGFLGNYVPLADLMVLNYSNPEYIFEPVDWTLRDATGKPSAPESKPAAPATPAETGDKKPPAKEHRP